MARMIPAVFDPGTASDGEKQVFRQLKKDPIAKDWIVLHSLDLANHISQISGEIDFVIIVPNKAVICLEVKDAKEVTRSDDGLWHLGRKKPEKRGPFRQSSLAAHSLRNYVVEKDPSLSAVVFWSCVAFTSSNFEKASVEWHPWQSINKRDIRRSGICKLILNVVISARKLLSKTPTATWFNPDRKVPNEEQVERLTSIMRPCFEFFESPSDRQDRIEAELKRYTEEQAQALDDMADNPRVIFTGPAGSGKTLLAIEAARREANLGRRVLLVCYNRLLGKWINKAITPISENVWSGNFASLLLETTGQTPPKNARSRFWDFDLPQKFNALATEGTDALPTYDTLIIDEAQDLFQATTLDCLDHLISGGLMGGRLIIFADFENQDIMSKGEVSLHEFREQYVTDVAIRRLRNNCRNTYRIAWMVQVLSELNPPYSKILRPDDGNEPVTKFYSSEQHQKQLLREALNLAGGYGYSAKQIVVLSNKDAKSVARKLGEEEPGILCDYLTDAEPPSGARGQATTIKKFKGLDAPVIVLTDFDEVGTDEARSAAYVGMSRATERLFLIANKCIAKEVLELLARHGREPEV